MKYNERKRLGAQKDYSQRRREGKLNEQVQKLKEENNALIENLVHQSNTQNLNQFLEGCAKYITGENEE